MKYLLLTINLMILSWAVHGGELLGTASYRERIALPKEARFQAILYDTTKGQIEIGRVEMPATEGPPYRFAIPFEDRAVSENGRYGLMTQIIWPERTFLAAGTSISGYAGGQQPEIHLIMVRPGVSPASAQEPATSSGTQGLTLPATFIGSVTRTTGQQEQWQMNVWPDQSFQYKLTTAKDVREQTGTSRELSGLGRWHIDRSGTRLVFDHGRERPLFFRVKDQAHLQWADPENPGTVGTLESVGSLQALELKNLLLTGMVIYMADAARITLCQTGKSLSVSTEGDYLTLEKAYLKHRSAPGEPLYMMFEGGLETREQMEGPPQQTAIVDRFLRTVPVKTCEEDMANSALEKTNWRIAEILGRQIVIDETFRSEPQMKFERGERDAYSLTVGCNRMRGGFRIDREKITFDASASTMMACPAPVAELEQAIGQALADVTGYAIVEDTLSLLAKDGNVLVKLKAN